MNKNRAIGSILIIAGTTVGAGILALPMISSGEGFPYAIITLVGLWALMLYGALMILEVNLIFPHGSSFSTLGAKTLGRPGQIVMNLCMMLLFYCLTAAYISGGTDFITTGLQQYFHVHSPPWLNSIIFTVVLGALVSWNTYAVDVANRFLLSIKMIAFFIVIFFLFPHVNYSMLAVHPHGSYFILMTIPIFFTAFGFHGSIPSIVKYVGHHPKTLRRIFVIGSAIPLVLYLLWEIVTLGILPRQGSVSFAAIAAQHGTVANFIDMLSKVINIKFITVGINFFTAIAMTTSFLGVTLGLSDFFADIFKAKKHFFRRAFVAIATFVPPLLFTILYPKGFILALGYAAIPLALLAIVLPAMMALCTRKKYHKDYPYRVAGGKIGISIMVIFGLTVIILQILSSLKLLPNAMFDF
jgi:tyrosine-specific transport protein